MGELLSSDPIHAVVSDNPLEGVTIAAFSWDIYNPEHTYTLELGGCASVELDRSFPVHPQGVRRLYKGLIGTDELLASFFGEEFAEVMQQAHDTEGIFHFDFRIPAVGRLGLARKQRDSPSTPTALRKSGEGMVRALEASFEEKGIV